MLGDVEPYEYETYHRDYPPPEMIVKHLYKCKEFEASMKSHKLNVSLVDVLYAVVNFAA